MHPGIQHAGGGAEARRANSAGLVLVPGGCMSAAWEEAREGCSDAGKENLHG